MQYDIIGRPRSDSFRLGDSELLRFTPPGTTDVPRPGGPGRGLDLVLPATTIPVALLLPFFSTSPPMFTTAVDDVYN